MKSSRRLLLSVLLVGVAVTGARAHDMFLKLPSFFLEPGSTVEIALFNGTFERSENPITRDRMRDVSVVAGDATVTHPPDAAWEDRATCGPGSREPDTSFLTFDVGEPGTYLVGVSTAPTVFELSAEDFNDYLRHDGVPDILELRRRQGILDRPAVERYSKHVKALAQVGDARTDTYRHELGYPAEIVPLDNPYELVVGDALMVRFLAGGAPVAGQLLHVGHEGAGGHHDGDHEHGEDGAPAEISLRTDEAGEARISLDEAGRWYVRTIHMVERDDEPEVDYESNWATLTFEVR